MIPAVAMTGHIWRKAFTRCLATTTTTFTPTARQQDGLRLSMSKLIQRLSVLPLPNYKNTLKHNTQQLHANANDTLRCLLILLTRRLQRLSSLSFIMMMNPHMARIWDAYLHSYGELIQFIAQHAPLEKGHLAFDDITAFKVSKDAENEKFVSVLQDIMDMHTDNVIDLRDGIHETKAMGKGQRIANAKRGTDAAAVTAPDADDSLFAGFSEKQFLDEHLSERVLMRLIANNHILLSQKQGDGGEKASGTLSSGVLDNNLNILDVLSRSVEFVNDMSILKYDERVDVVVNTRIIDEDGNYTCEENVDLRYLDKHQKLIFPYIGNHIEYVLNEILKNSTRALIENRVLKPVEILIVLNRSKRDSPPTLQIKISDHGGGIRPDILPKLWEYSFTTVNSSNGGNDSNSNANVSSGSNSLFTKSGKDIELGAAHDLGFGSSGSVGADNLVSDNLIAGMGYGLPLSLTYCQLFGGDIHLHSVWGEGTDVYVALKGL